MIEVTPVLVITPVPETYEIPVPPESDVEEILLLKRVKSADERYPFCERVAWLILMAFPVRVSGVLKVRGFSRPSEEVAVRV